MCTRTTGGEYVGERKTRETRHGRRPAEVLRYTRAERKRQREREDEAQRRESNEAERGEELAKGARADGRA